MTDLSGATIVFVNNYRGPGLGGGETQLLHLVRGCARPVGADHHHAEGEGRILALAQAQVGDGAADQQQPDQEARERRMLDGPARQVERFFCGLHGRRR